MLNPETRHEGQNQPTQSEISNPNIKRARTRFFSNFALQEASTFKFLMRAGGLEQIKKRYADLIKRGVLDLESWRNISEHCLTESVAIDTLARSLSLPDEEIENLKIAAALHDWDKRITKEIGVSKGVFWREVLEFLQGRVGRRADSINTLLNTTAPGITLDRVKRGDNISLPEKIMYLIDEITSGNRLVTIADRVAVSRQRNANLEEIYGEKYKNEGGYFDFEEKVAGQFQADIVALLKERGCDIAPDKLPSWLTDQIDQRIIEFERQRTNQQ